MLNGQAVGTVQLSKEGLYLRILCRCTVADGKIHRLYAEGEKLGVLIPENGELVLNTKVAAKHLKPECRFSLDGEEGEFYPIRPGEPFAHLDKLRRGRLERRGNLFGLALDG